MKKLTVEVNDQEICRRLETLMVTSKEDLNLSSVKLLLEKPLDFDPKDIPEPYTQNIRHFIYMVKRNEKQGTNKHQFNEGEAPARERAVAKPRKTAVTSKTH
ncbi:MAG: hypothetical protein K8R21_08055 [Leptospira sp.]|nr:hypothetical protein [Leptospira sp.]